MRLSVRPADWLQHGSDASQRTNKQEHGQYNHEEECCSHVVQHRDHGTSLHWLGSLTTPSAFTDPWAHGVSLLKRPTAARTLSGPNQPLPLFIVYRFTRCMPSISV